MPYKDKEKAKAFAREAMRRKRRGKTKTNVIPYDVIPSVLHPVGNPIDTSSVSNLQEREWQPYSKKKQVTGRA